MLSEVGAPHNITSCHGPANETVNYTVLLCEFYGVDVRVFRVKPKLYYVLDVVFTPHKQNS